MFLLQEDKLPGQLLQYPVATSGLTSEDLIFFINPSLATLFFALF